MVSDRQLKHWFDKYNAKYFGGELPPHTVIYWEPPVDSAQAETCNVFEVDHGQFCIKINPSIKGVKYYWHIVLLHEMVHLKLWTKHPKHQHGKVFQNEMLDLAQRGAFKSLW